jgi:hypothetical protein
MKKAPITAQHPSTVQKVSVTQRTSGIAKWTKLTLLALLGGASMLQGHDLDTSATSIQFAKDFIATMASRAAASQPLMQVGDEFWVSMKTTLGREPTPGAVATSPFICQRVIK